MLGYVLLDELHKRIGHIRALGSRGCLKLPLEGNGDESGLDVEPREERLQ